MAMIDFLAVGLGGFLVLVGTTHFVWTGYFEELVPPWLPGPRTLVLVSGGAEVAIGVGLLYGGTRQLAATIAVGLLTVYVLTHVDALHRSSPAHAKWLDRPPGASVRVLVNLLYVVWAASVAFSA